MSTGTKKTKNKHTPTVSSLSKNSSFHLKSNQPRFCQSPATDRQLDLRLGAPPFRPGAGVGSRHYGVLIYNRDISCNLMPLFMHRPAEISALSSPPLPHSICPRLRFFFLPSLFFATRERRAAVCVAHAHSQRMAPRLRLTCVGCAVSGIVAAYK